MSIGAAAAAAARPRNALALIVLYCLLHWAIRMAVSPVYTLDEAEQVLFSQSWQWGYRFRHPPLMTWIYAGVEDVFGLHRWSVHAVKYLIMAGGFAAFYLAARRLLARPEHAALAVLAWAATWSVGVAPHIDLTHTVLLTAMLFLNLHAFVLAVQRGTLAAWLWFGVTAGLGALSKYVFVIQPTALLLALIAAPALRAKVSGARVGAGIAAALLIVAPYAVWTLAEGYSLAELGQEASRGGGASLNPLVWIQGILGLALAMLEFSLPLLLIFAIAFPLALKPGAMRAGPAAALTQVEWARFFQIAILIGAALFSVAVFAYGATEFKSRWMHQILASLPILLFLRAEAAGSGTPRRRAAFALTALVLILLIAALRFIVNEQKPYSCSPKCREFQPVASWAANLRGAGFTGGTVVASEHHLGGNLRAQLGGRVLSAPYPPEAFPAPDGDGQCLLVWSDAEPDGQARVFAYAADALGVTPPDGPAGAFTRPVLGNPDAQMTLGYAFAAPTPLCR